MLQPEPEGGPATRAWSLEPAHALELAGHKVVCALAAGDADADGASVVWGCVGRELVRWGEPLEEGLRF